MEFQREYLELAHKHSIFNKKEITQSETCGCFYCLKTFKSNEIQLWTDEDHPKGETAQCPYCDIDSVIGDKSGFPISDNHFLFKMHSFYFL